MAAEVGSSYLTEVRRETTEGKVITDGKSKMGKPPPETLAQPSPMGPGIQKTPKKPGGGGNKVGEGCDDGGGRDKNFQPKPFRHKAVSPQKATLGRELAIPSVYPGAHNDRDNPGTRENYGSGVGDQRKWREKNCHVQKRGKRRGEYRRGTFQPPISVLANITWCAIKRIKGFLGIATVGGVSPIERGNGSTNSENAGKQRGTNGENAGSQLGTFECNP